jgi:hypothetical protein
VDPAAKSVYVVGGSSLLAFCAALAVLDAERRNPEANISDFGDAMWWAVTTLTTVGYGDRYLTTGPGRLVAFGLMVAGIALLGTVTATLASWLVDQVSRTEDREVSDLRTQIDVLNLKIDQLLSTTERRGAATSATLTATAEPSELRSSPYGHRATVRYEGQWGSSAVRKHGTANAEVYPDERCGAPLTVNSISDSQGASEEPRINSSASSSEEASPSWTFDTSNKPARHSRR